MVVAKFGNITGNTSYTISRVVTPPTPSKIVKQISWDGEIPNDLWAIFYTKFLSKFVSDNDVRLNVHVEIVSKLDDGISKQTVEEAKLILKELKINDKIEEG